MSMDYFSPSSSSHDSSQSALDDKSGGESSQQQQPHPHHSHHHPQQYPTPSPPTPTSSRHVCKVCGDKGIGFNFGVQTCESCKAFFRRNALLKKEFKCPFENDCTITIQNRKYCKKCRLIKCLQVGMRKDLILSDEEKQRKKQRRAIQCDNNRKHIKSQNSNYVLKREDSINDFFQEFYGGNVELVIDKIENGYTIFPHQELLDFVCNKAAQCQAMYLNLIEDQPIPFLFDEFSLSEEDKFRLQELNKASLILLPRYVEIENQIANLISAFQASEAQIISIIKMAKQLRSFRKLSIDDQIVVLKNSIKEILPLWNVLVYDRQINCIVYYNQITKSCIKINFELINQYCSTQISSMYKKFIVSFQELYNNDVNVFNLFIVIILFKPKPSLPQRDFLRTEYLAYTQLLKKYLRNKCQDRCEAQTLFIKCLYKLEELYALSAIFFKCLDNIDTSQLTNFFKEVFNINF